MLEMVDKTDLKMYLRNLSAMARNPIVESPKFGGTPGSSVGTCWH